MSEEIRNKIMSLYLKMKVPDKTLHTHSGSGGTASTVLNKQHHKHLPLPDQKRTEPSLEKKTVLVSDQVQHKSACTVTEAG